MGHPGFGCKNGPCTQTGPGQGVRVQSRVTHQCSLPKGHPGAHYQGDPAGAACWANNDAINRAEGERIPSWVQRDGGVRLECSQCGGWQLLPLIDSPEGPAISIVEADGWEVTPGGPRLCPKCQDDSSSDG
jgi:hypothetical protein